MPGVPRSPRLEGVTRSCRDVAQATLARPAFVGRTSELQQLLRVFETARHGSTQMVVIQGPAGIGKTRLAEELVEQAAAQGALVALGGCWLDGEAPPLWPWRTILHRLGAPASLIGEPVAPQARFTRFVAVLERLRLATRRRPAVLVIDDAHWADPASLLLCGFVTRARDLPLLLALTSREPAPGCDAPLLLTELAGQGLSVPLGGLSKEAVGTFLSSIAGFDARDAPLLQTVTTVTRGNPLHLRSLAMHSELQAEGLRGGLERTIAECLRRLAPQDRRLLALGALIGPQVSVHELARVADTAPATAAESLAHAVSAGLMQAGLDDCFGFVHDVVQQIALGTLQVPDRLEAHARAASVLAGHGADQWSRRAFHALAAASRSPEDARVAVRVARDAAHALQRVDGFEAAAGLLERASEIHAAAAVPDPGAALAVERAEAVLACGRLAEARPLFQAAARIADIEGDACALARAALGLGGVWINEHRLADEAERVRALQRRAFAGLPADAHVLAARLRVRLAAEAAYQGSGTLADLLAALAAVRATGDARALAEALSLAHHAMLSPEYTWRRLALAQELVVVAAAAGDSLASLIGQCWQTVDLFLLDDPGAPTALEELRARAAALRCLSVVFIVRCMDVMLAIRAGRLEEAEQAAATACALGREVGDADALPYHGAHLSAIRFFQGREAELGDMVASLASSPVLVQERERAFACSAALFALRAGRPQPAQVLLQRLRREGLGSIPLTSSWMTSLLGVVELAAALQDAPIAQASYDLLLPYADLPLMASLAVVCFGSTHRVLGLAAQTCGKLDLAIEHFAAALAANEQLGHRPAAAQARAELALARLRRAAPAHDARCDALLQNAMEEAQALGLDGLVARWRATSVTLRPASTSRLAPEVALMTLVRGSKWRVVLGSEVATVRDRVGMHYLARLLAAPEHDIPSLLLVLDGASPPHERGGGNQPVLDRRALAALRERVRELREAADSSGGSDEELRTLTRELARASGLGGRVRSFADAPERARTAVRLAAITAGALAAVLLALVLGDVALRSV